MRPFDIHALLEGLAKKRPVFHSEADFQFALAWEIRKAEGLDVRLEFPPFPGKRMYLDLWLPGRGLAIELKYLTRKLNVDTGNERFALRDQAARDISRYDFVKDVTRLERLAMDFADARGGVAVLLTNDPLYWEPSWQGRETVDDAFRLHEGRLSGELAWSEHAGEGTTKGRSEPHVLRGSYPLLWRDYGHRFTEATETRGTLLRYLAIEVRR